MARNLASSGYLETTSPPVTEAPLTIACWFKADALNDTDVISLCDQDVAGNFGFHLQPWSDGIVYATTSASGSTQFAATSTTYSAGVWNHATGVFSATNSRAVYLNGGGKGTDTGSATPTGVDRCSIGRAPLSPNQYFSGGVAEVGVWSAALTDDEALSLAYGVSPLLVRPTALVGYWPLFVRATNEEDWTGGTLMTMSGTTSAVDHPPVFYPPRRRTLVVLGAGDPEALMELLFGQESL